MSNRSVATFIKELVLEALDVRETIPFTPGDYLQLDIPTYDSIRFQEFDIPEPFASVWENQHVFDLVARNPTIVRRNNYSLASNPSTERTLRFNIRIATPPPGQDCAPGVGSSYVFSLKPGDVVSGIGPSGDFHIKPTQREMIYIGGGAGMAPLRAHLSHLLEREQTARKISFWYGARSTYENGGVLSTFLKPDAFDLLSKTMRSLMEGSLDPDLLNREAGYGETSEFRFQHSDPDALNAGLHYLLLRCWRSRLTGRATRDPVVLHPAIRRALQLLRDETTERSLEELAKVCGVSKSYLCRKFHQQIGVSFTRYRNSLRLSRFFEQYHRTDQPTITESVYAAGFGSYVQFYKVFSQVYGRGPRSCLRNDSVPIGKPIT